MAKIAILGYGKMGKEIEKILLQYGHIIIIIDNEDDWTNHYSEFCDCDVAIEFSTPQSVINNLYRCFDANVPIVCGTTGWNNETQAVIDYCKQKSGSLVYGSNFCIGANLFFKMNELMAQMMNQQPEYDVTIEETHHVTKKDAPSGTAITTANLIINQLDRKTNWKLNDNSQSDTIHVLAHRLGEEPGTHVVRYTSENDCIEITHKIYQRSALASGAVKAAMWLINHHGVYQFKDIFMELNAFAK